MLAASLVDVGRAQDDPALDVRRRAAEAGDIDTAGADDGRRRATEGVGKCVLADVVGLEAVCYTAQVTEDGRG